MMELSDYRRGLFQWDTGRSLIVTEKDITEVHFQLLPPPSGSTETTDVPVSAGIAKIPDELLQSGLPIRAYAWGDGYSHYDQTFCVTKREKPTGYASDPSDAITLESVQAKLQAEIDGKIQIPQGGDTGDVLKKTESGVEWGQAAGQSDWAENDETAPGYVKNRPFYTGDPVETVLVEESTVTFVKATNTIYMAQIQSNFEATVGKTFKVSWDGTTYESPCVNFAGSLYVGNLSIMGRGSDTGEPFLIYLANGSGIEIYTLDTSASHTISIKCAMTEIVKIPEKYLNRHTHILTRYFWETSSKSKLIDIVNQFNAGDVFVYQHDTGTAAFLLCAGYGESSGFTFMYMYNYAIVKITGGVGNWTTKTATIEYS